MTFLLLNKTVPSYKDDITSTTNQFYREPANDQHPKPLAACDTAWRTLSLTQGHFINLSSSLKWA